MATAAALTIAIRAKTKDLEQAMKRSAKRVRTFKRDVRLAADAVSNFSRRALMLGAAGFVALTKAAADFEHQLAMVSTMLEGPAMSHLTAYGKQLTQLASDYGQSTVKLSKGLYDLLSARVRPEHAMQALEVATRGAIGGMTDVATSTKAMIRVLRAYNLEATHAADVSDLLFAIVKRGVINYEETAESISKVAPMAKAAGMSLTELGAAMATVVSAEEPERAMTALRMAIVQSQAAGVDFMDWIREFQGATLADIIQAGIPKRAAQGVVILANSMELLEVNLEFVAKRAGQSEEAFEKMYGTTRQAFNQMKQDLINAAKMIGKHLLPVAKELIERIKVFAKKLKKLSDGEIQDLINKTKKWGKIFLALWIGPKIIAGLKAALNVLILMKIAVVAIGVSLSAIIALPLAGLAAAFVSISNSIEGSVKHMNELERVTKRAAKHREDARKHQEKFEKTGAIQSRIKSLESKMAGYKDDIISLEKDKALYEKTARVRERADKRRGRKPVDRHVMFDQTVKLIRMHQDRVYLIEREIALIKQKALLNEANEKKRLEAAEKLSKEALRRRKEEDRTVRIAGDIGGMADMIKFVEKVTKAMKTPGEKLLEYSELLNTAVHLQMMPLEMAEKAYKAMEKRLIAVSPLEKFAEKVKQSLKTNVELFKDYRALIEKAMSLDILTKAEGQSALVKRMRQLMGKPMKQSEFKVINRATWGPGGANQGIKLDINRNKLMGASNATLGKILGEVKGSLN